MATKQATADYLLEQIEDAGTVKAKRMFGEFGVSCDGKNVALICDEQLYVKPTEAGENYIGKPETGYPFPGAKKWFLISGDKWEDSDWLTELIQVTAKELPLPKPKKPRKKK